jgi:predicted dehydrogenase
MRPYGVGIIGTGFVAGPYVQAFEGNPHFAVQAICSRREERAREFATGLGLTRYKSYTDYEQMCVDPDVDVVVIATPNSLHANQTIAAAQAGKHVVIEKPVAIRYEDLARMKKAVDEAGVKTVVGFVLRWHPLFITLKELQAAGELGALFYLETDYFHEVRLRHPNLGWSGTREMGGSAILSAGCHAVDAAHYFMEDEAIEVFAYDSGCRHPKLDYPSTIITLVKFKGGGMAKIGCSREMKQHYVFNVRLYGDRGTAVNNRLYLRQLSQVDQYIDLPVEVPSSGHTAHHPFPAEVAHFAQCLEDNVESHCNLNDAIATHEICFAADISAAEGRPVQLPLN